MFLAADTGLVLKLDHPASHVLRSGVDGWSGLLPSDGRSVLLRPATGLQPPTLPPAWPAPRLKPLHAPATTVLAFPEAIRAPSFQPAP